jgi:hypothetical protein
VKILPRVLDDTASGRFPFAKVSLPIIAGRRRRPSAIVQQRPTIVWIITAYQSLVSKNFGDLLAANELHELGRPLPKA